MQVDAEGRARPVRSAERRQQMSRKRRKPKRPPPGTPAPDIKELAAWHQKGAMDMLTDTLAAIAEGRMQRPSSKKH
jgi:hypothetical protein